MNQTSSSKRFPEFKGQVKILLVYVLVWLHTYTEGVYVYIYIYISNYSQTLDQLSEQTPMCVAVER